MHQVQAFAQTCIQSYPSQFALGAAVVCATATLEMAIKTIKDIPNLADENVRKNFSANLGGTLFYGICAANIVPHTALLGASIFTLYSVYKCEEKDAYITSQLVGKSIRGIWNHVIIPVANTIRKVVAETFNLISLPKHPVWYGVAALVVAVVAYKGFPGVGAS